MRPWFFLFPLCISLSLASASLPESKTFVGKDRYAALFNRAKNANWAALPIGERTARIGMELTGTPYVNYTLELDDRIEAPSVNMRGMDCWTFFEISLATARAVKLSDRPDYGQMLRLIEMDRYRGGKCDGKFSSRLHHLEDWLQDNERRGLVEDITPKLPGARKLKRDMNYMAKNWKSFRQLRVNPALIPAIDRSEKALSAKGIYYVPTAQVPAAEKYLKNGDIISIVSTWPGTYTNHVGLAYRDKKGVLRFLHASRDKRAVILDSRLSTYLKTHRSKQAGIMVARPKDL